MCLGGSFLACQASFQPSDTTSAGVASERRDKKSASVRGTILCAQSLARLLAKVIKFWSACPLSLGLKVAYNFVERYSSAQRSFVSVRLNSSSIRSAYWQHFMALSSLITLLKGRVSWMEILEVKLHGARHMNEWLRHYTLQSVMVRSAEREGTCCRYNL
jgi:hypothetical protein